MTRRSVIRGRALIQPLYTALRVRNLERSIRFYRVLGFRQTMRMRTALGEFAQLEHPSSGFTIELNYFPRGSRAYEPLRKGTELDHFGFEVDDVDAWVTKLCRAGGKVKIRRFNGKTIIHEKGATHDSWKDGCGAYVADPDGIWIELLGPLRPRHE
jgi:catechol 2,3-dioxygenase-like lactoylglutathione lyase family enzyme